VQQVRQEEQAVVRCEVAPVASIPELPGTSGAAVNPEADIIDQVLMQTGSTVLGAQEAWVGYVDQPVATLIEVSEAQVNHSSGMTVAIIDTGIDPDHPILANWLLPGYDFISSQPGASEWSDLDQSSAAILEQSSAAILESSTAIQLNQSSAAILEEYQIEALDPSLIPPAFGHGTMVAGVVHRVVPEANIMPLRAFTGSGYGNLADIIEAIYYAVDNGADVINMSFSFDGYSTELTIALYYAAANGVICTASVGNNGRHARVYPAYNYSVIGTASSTLDDYVSDFSNYGKRLCTIAAPGEYVITTYPGGGWAVASGTSFAAPWISGGAALMAEQDASIGLLDVLAALANAVRLRGPHKNQVGFGRVNLNDAMLALGNQ
jgi:thermitase